MRPAAKASLCQSAWEAAGGGGGWGRPPPPPPRPPPPTAPPPRPPAGGGGCGGAGGGGGGGAPPPPATHSSAGVSGRTTTAGCPCSAATWARRTAASRDRRRCRDASSACSMGRAGAEAGVGGGAVGRVAGGGWRRAAVGGRDGPAGVPAHRALASLRGVQLLRHLAADAGRIALLQQGDPRLRVQPREQRGAERLRAHRRPCACNAGGQRQAARGAPTGCPAAPLRRSLPRLHIHPSWRGARGRLPRPGPRRRRGQQPHYIAPPATRAAPVPHAQGTGAEHPGGEPSPVWPAACRLCVDVSSLHLGHVCCWDRARAPPKNIGPSGDMAATSPGSPPPALVVGGKRLFAVRKPRIPCCRGRSPFSRRVFAPSQLALASTSGNAAPGGALGA